MVKQVKGQKWLGSIQIRREKNAILGGKQAGARIDGPLIKKWPRSD